MRLNKLDERGYLLLESLTALSIVSVMILVYVPFMENMIQKMEREKMEVEMHRLLYDGVRQEMEGKAATTERITGKWRFDLIIDSKSQKKGIRVKDATGTKEEKVQILSIQWD